MIRVNVTVMMRQYNFQFEPDAKFWVLSGISLAKIEQAIRDAIEQEPADAWRSDGDPMLKDQLSACAQKVIDSLVTSGVIREW